jgi:hypothetical protein
MEEVTKKLEEVEKIIKDIWDDKTVNATTKMYYISQRVELRRMKKSLEKRK